MPRALVLAATTGYQTRSFGEAAERLGVDLVFATDRCHMIEDPWRDRAIPIRFHDEESSVQAILEAAGAAPIDGVLAVGDRPTVIAARVARALGLPGNPPEAAAVARDKGRTRERLSAAGMPSPWFVPMTLDSDAQSLAASLRYPVVVKPVSLSGSRGVMRADDAHAFVEACERVRKLLRKPDVLAERTDAHDRLLVEGFIPGREYAVEALLQHGDLHVLAVFDKPDPLDGPFFEETIYITPSATDPHLQRSIVDAVAGAAEAMGLRHGAVHAECRVNDQGVYVLEVAARPIGGLCARALRFERRRTGGSDRVEPISFEQLLLAHALGETPAGWQRESPASGVMMIPIPRRGLFRGVSGLESARQVEGIDDVRVTAKPDQLLVPLPEGASYLGFIFARAARAADVEQALRAAHECMTFSIDPEIPVIARG
jgi:predicted ATP-grasp superfamily ATP-dependent carboligase